MKRILIIVTLLWVNLSPVNAQDLGKYQAVFIRQFVKYLEWSPKKDPVIIGVLGNSSALIHLQQAGGNDSHIQVIKVASSDQVIKCDILFIPANQSRNLNMIQSQLNGKSTLIVAEEVALAEQGADIGFFVEGNKLRFALNKSKIEEKEIRISNTLLSLAKVI